MPAEVIRHEARLRPPFAPWPMLSLSCCTFRTDWFDLRHEMLAFDAMSAHLLAEHPDEFGRCSTCGKFTDHVRIDAGPLGEAWLCETHSPTMSEMVPA